MTAAKTIALEARHAEQILKHIPDLKVSASKWNLTLKGSD